MNHMKVCRVCRNYRPILGDQDNLCSECRSTLFRVRCTTCRSVTVAYPAERNPKCKKCKGRFCKICQEFSPVAMLTLDQVCLDCAKKSPSAVYKCDRCEGYFEIEIDDSLPKSKPGYVLCWHCTLQDSGEL